MLCVWIVLRILFVCKILMNVYPSMFCLEYVHTYIARAGFLVGFILSYYRVKRAEQVLSNNLVLSSVGSHDPCTIVS